MSQSKKAKQVVDIIAEYIEKQGSMEELRSIVDEFDSLLKQEEKLSTAIVTTAFAIDEQTQIRCESILKDLFGSELEFEYVVNPNLLGGMKIKVYDQVMDLSLDTALTNISQSLKQ